MTGTERQVTAETKHVARRAPGGIGLDCLKDIATHGTLSVYWDPMNLIWIAQELVRARELLQQAQRLFGEIETRRISDPTPAKICAWEMEPR